MVSKPREIDHAAFIDQAIKTICLGKKGGSTTAGCGSDYFRKLAAKRKTFGGGRPPKESA